MYCAKYWISFSFRSFYSVIIYKLFTMCHLVFIIFIFDILDTWSRCKGVNILKSEITPTNKLKYHPLNVFNEVKRGFLLQIIRSLFSLTLSFFFSKGIFLNRLFYLFRYKTWKNWFPFKIMPHKHHLRLYLLKSVLFKGIRKTTSVWLEAQNWQLSIFWEIFKRVYFDKVPSISFYEIINVSLMF